MKKKQIVKIIVALILMISITGLSVFTGIITNITMIFDTIKVSMGNLIKVIIMATFIKAIQWLIVLLLDIIIPRNKRGKTAVSIFESLINYIALIVIVCWGFVLLGVNVGTVLASVGIVALIVGFGAESLIEDVITGIFMLFENQYNIDDIIEVDGFRGRVVEIGIRTTVIQDNGQNKKIINNSAMQNILNKSIAESKAVCDLGISYECDLKKLEVLLPNLLERIRNTNSQLFKSSIVYLGVQELASSAVMLRFVADVEEKNIYDAQRCLNRELYLGLKELGYKIPYQIIDIQQ